MSTENRFGSDVSRPRGGGGGFEPLPMGDFGASGPKLAAAATTASIADVAVSEYKQNHAFGASAAEKEFYSRRPNTPLVQVGDTYVNMNDMSYSRRTENGNFVLKSGQVLSQKDFNQLKNIIVATDNSHRVDMKKWRDEGIARGFVYADKPTRR